MIELVASDRGSRWAALTVVSFVISGLLLAAMIGISWYGAVTLPPDARIPIHYRLGAYNNFASKTTGLIVWPVVGALAVAVLAALSAHAIKPNHSGGGQVPLIILPILLLVITAAQWGAISVARKNAATPEQ
jgi:hypothetical protein